MAYNHTEIRKFLGLYLQRNSFEVPDGALEVASNCVVDQDFVIKKRRGYSQFANPGGTLNNLVEYDDTLMGLSNAKMSAFSSSGVETVLSGDTVALTGGRVGRFAKSNENLYFTSDNGVMAIEDAAGPVRNAGIPPALDLRANLLAANGPISGNSQVGYRVLFGRRDTNENLLLGSPSDITVITNLLADDDAAVEAALTVTVTTASPHNLATGMEIEVSDAKDGGGTPVAGVDGTQTITVTGPSTFTFTIAAPAAALASLDWKSTRSASLEFSIPSEITSSEYFYQVYRTTESNSGAAAPSADFKLVKESNLTSAELTARMVFFTDDIEDIFLGAELYTNPNSREGELQANERPPLCDDLTLFKGMMLYGNCTSRQILNVALVSSDVAFINNNDYVEIKLGATTRRYVARTGVGNSTVTGTAAGAGTVTITYASHGLVNGDTVYVSNVTGTVPAGSYVVSGVAANTFDITPGGALTATALDFQGVTNLAGYYIFQLVAPTLSVAAGLDATARGLVKAINRDTSSLVYAKYASGISDVPGKILMQAKGFGSEFYMRANTLTVGQAFAPELPDSFASGTQVVSDNDRLPHGFYVSKIGEPEAVPFTNNYFAGSKNSPILRIIALRDTVVILKDEGTYVVYGDTPDNLSVTTLDSTSQCVAPSSAVLLDNQVFFLSDQGVCRVSGSSVEIVSRKIEVPLVAVLTQSTLATQTSGTAYESERLYLLTTLEPRQTTATVTYCYNTLTDSWTTWDELFKNATVGPDDKMYLISTASNVIKKERKNQNKLDYAGQDYATTVVSVSSDKMSAVISIVGAVPQAGDVLVQGSIINRIKTAAPSGVNYALTFEAVSNLVAAQTPTLYKSFTSVIKFAPYHAGQMNRSKHFGQFQVHTRDNAISVLDITFANDTFGGSEPVTWRASNVIGTLGWGQLPWGLFPWGVESSIDLQYSTQPAPMIRTYVPRHAARTTFIQPILTHAMAAEQLVIQSVGFQVRGLGERVSK